MSSSIAPWSVNTRTYTAYREAVLSKTLADGRTAEVRNARGMVISGTDNTDGKAPLGFTGLQGSRKGLALLLPWLAVLSRTEDEAETLIDKLRNLVVTVNEMTGETSIQYKHADPRRQDKIYMGTDDRGNKHYFKPDLNHARAGVVSTIEMAQVSGEAAKWNQTHDTLIVRGDGVIVSGGKGFGKHRIIGDHTQFIGRGGADQVFLGGVGHRVNTGSGNDFVRISSGDRLNPATQSIVDLGTGNDRLEAGDETIVDGGSGSDEIKVGSNSIVDGGADMDFIHIRHHSIAIGGTGNDFMYASSNNIVEGGEGNDSISVGIGNAVEGGEGNDRISLHADNNADGGEGDDFFTSTKAGNIIRGGLGNDVVIAKSDVSLVIERGDGHDILQTAGHAVVDLGAGISRDRVSISTIGDNIFKIDFGTGDSLTVHLNEFEERFYKHLHTGSLTLRFADGSTLGLARTVEHAENDNDQHQIVGNAALEKAVETYRQNAGPPPIIPGVNSISFA
jgi:hypothetical protein